MSDKEKDEAAIRFYFAALSRGSDEMTTLEEMTRKFGRSAVLHAILHKMKVSPHSKEQRLRRNLMMGA